jgi:cell division transport system permease protein
MTAVFAFRLALQSILHEKWINLLSVLTITAGLLIAAFTALSLYNVNATMKRIPQKVSMMLYLRDNLSREKVENILDTAKKNSAVETVKYISKEEAIKELKAVFKDASYILEGLGENPLHDSIEIRLKGEQAVPETAKRLAAEMAKVEGINDVEYGERFLSSLYSFGIGIKAAGILFIIVMVGGVIFVCYSTVKILFYRKKEEIETYKLLGATRGFIRAPFIVEGAAIGLCGGLLSLIGILLLHYVVFLKLSLSIPLFRAIIFPISFAPLLPLTGFLLGMTGAAIAIGRIRY